MKRLKIGDKAEFIPIREPKNKFDIEVTDRSSEGLLMKGDREGFGYDGWIFFKDFDIDGVYMPTKLYNSSYKIVPYSKKMTYSKNKKP